MGYLYLSVAIICGITANSLAKISDGFSKLGPSIACIILIMKVVRDIMTKTEKV